MKTIDINSIPRQSATQKTNIKPGIKDEEAIDPTRNRYELENMNISIQGRKNKILLLCFVIVAASIAWKVFRAYQNWKDLTARNEEFRATYYFEAGEFEKAIHGDGTHKGLLEIIAKYPNTNTGILAKYRLGVAYMHQKEYGKAISALDQFFSNDSILRGRAWCVIGDAYSAQKNTKQAAVYYLKAARHSENSVYAPGYLIKAAIAFEASMRYKDAYNCYQELIDKYPKTHYANALAIKEASRLFVHVVAH